MLSSLTIVRKRTDGRTDGLVPHIGLSPLLRKDYLKCV